MAKQKTLADVDKRAAELTSMSPADVSAERAKVGGFINAYLASIQEGKSVGSAEMKDGPFANLNAAESLAKFHELSLEHGALLKVEGANAEADAHRDLEARREAGDPSAVDPTAGPALRAVPRTKSIGDLYAELLKESKLDPKAVTPQRFEFGASAEERFALMSKLVQTDSDNTGIEPFYQTLTRVVQIPIVQIHLLNMIPRQMIMGTRVEWQEMTSRTDGTGYRQEGAASGEMDVRFTQRRRELEILSAHTVATDEALMDQGFMRGLLDNQLRTLFNKKLGDDIMVGTGNNQIDGFGGAQYVNSAQFNATAFGANRAQPAAGTAADRIQVWYSPDTSSSTGLQNTAVSSVLGLNEAAVDLVVREGVRPSAVAMSPATWLGIKTARDGDNNFLFPQNGFGMEMVPLLGVPVVPDSNIPNGRALMMDFAGNSMLFTRGGPMLEVGLNNDDFTRHQKTIRISGRFQTVIWRRQSARWVTNLTAGLDL